MACATSTLTDRPADPEGPPTNGSMGRTLKPGRPFIIGVTWTSITAISKTAGFHRLDVAVKWVDLVTEGLARGPSRSPLPAQSARRELGPGMQSVTHFGITVIAISFSCQSGISCTPGGLPFRAAMTLKSDCGLHKPV